MINKNVISDIDFFSKSFLDELPYKHVCIDNFLEHSDALKLLEDFPAFNQNEAKNEFGIISRKWVVPKMQDISPAYKKFSEYLLTPDFLRIIEKITGIDNLIIDPLHYGGGTHENIDGAELDVHVDFNYDMRTGNHRRLNLLLYLNPEWSEDWGGAIEIHSNPYGWIDSSDQIKTYNTIFNRCVIFETNEHSWHGFRKISLPENYKHLSRKLISIYLYTKDRPSDEIYPPHGTFYIPYPPPKVIRDFKEGDNLKSDDLVEVQRLMQKRDNLLRLGFMTEINLSRRLTQATALLEKYKSSLAPTLLGKAKVVPLSVKGYHLDHWVEPYFSVMLEVLESVEFVAVRGWVPDNCDQEIKICLNNFFESSHNLMGGAFSVVLPCKNNISDRLFIEIFSTKQLNQSSNDSREISFIIKEIELSNELIND